MPDRVRFYFDCVSPWSYIAFHVIQRYKQVWGIEVEYMPCSLAYVMSFSHNSPPVTVPNKGAQMMRELSASERMFGVPFSMPDGFPFTTFELMGLLLKVKDTHPDKFEAVLAAAFDGIFGQGRAPTTEAVRTLASRFFEGTELDSLLAYAQSRDARQRQKDEAHALVDDGAFGFPWMIATRADDGESLSVFGVDHMEHLAAFFHRPYLGPMATGETPRL